MINFLGCKIIGCERKALHKKDAISSVFLGILINFFKTAHIIYIIHMYNIYIYRAYFRKIKHPGIGRFVKKCPFFKKKLFLNLNQKCQKKNSLWGGYSISTCPSWSPKCSFVKQSCPFTEVKSPFPRIISLNSFILNNFFNFSYFPFEMFYHIFRISVL